MRVNQPAYATRASKRDNVNYPTLRTAQLETKIFFCAGDKYALSVTRDGETYMLYATVNREGESLRFDTWPKNWRKPTIGKSGRVLMRVNSIKLV